MLFQDELYIGQDSNIKITQNTVIKKNTNDKCRQGCGEKGTLIHCWHESKLVQTLEKSTSQNTKNVTTIWLSNSTLVYIPKEQKHEFEKIHATPIFIAALFTIAKIWKQPGHQQIQRKHGVFYIYTLTHTGILCFIYIHTHTHTHNGIPLNHKKQWNFHL